jgi:hypothetical protein
VFTFEFLLRISKRVYRAIRGVNAVEGHLTYSNHGCIVELNVFVEIRILRASLMVQKEETETNLEVQFDFLRKWGELNYRMAQTRSHECSCYYSRPVHLIFFWEKGGKEEYWKT